MRKVLPFLIVGLLVGCSPIYRHVTIKVQPNCNQREYVRVEGLKDPIMNTTDLEETTRFNQEVYHYKRDEAPEVKIGDIIKVNPEDPQDFEVVGNVNDMMEQKQILQTAEEITLENVSVHAPAKKLPKWIFIGIGIFLIIAILSLIEVSRRR